MTSNIEESISLRKSKIFSQETVSIQLNHMVSLPKIFLQNNNNNTTNVTTENNDNKSKHPTLPFILVGIIIGSVVGFVLFGVLVFYCYVQFAAHARHKAYLVHVKKRQQQGKDGEESERQFAKDCGDPTPTTTSTKQSLFYKTMRLFALGRNKSAEISPERIPTVNGGDGIGSNSNLFSDIGSDGKEREKEVVPKVVKFVSPLSSPRTDAPGVLMEGNSFVTRTHDDIEDNVYQQHHQHHRHFHHHGTNNNNNDEDEEEE